MRACIVIAGGAARRMGGVDKTMLQVGGSTLLDTVLSAAAPLCSRLVVVGPRRATTLREVVFTLEAEPGGGPVPAVLAGLAEVAPADEVFVLAADLARLSPAGLQQLLDELHRHRAEAAAAGDGSGPPNPLLAVYRADALARSAEVLRDNPRGMPASRLLPPMTVPVKLDARQTLNVNTPADLARAVLADQEDRV
ncbi:MAG TPA: molybdenum cofactor guanylyltransferase [Acidimicrobiales bacterium]|nr:molybdenum cofactor guanylyltransferase [Acidimicrobiales bacterium]